MLQQVPYLASACDYYLPDLHKWMYFGRNLCKIAQLGVMPVGNYPACQIRDLQIKLDNTKYSDRLCFGCQYNMIGN